MKILLFILLMLLPVNVSALEPGDSVLWNRGDTFREQIVIDDAGTNGSPITYDAYGTGADPIMLGSNDADTLAAWEASDLNGNTIWKTLDASYTLNPNIIWYDTNATLATATYEANCANLDTDWEWCYDADDDCVHLYYDDSAAEPSAGADGIEIPFDTVDDGQGVIFIAKWTAPLSYVEVYNLDVKYSRQEGVRIKEGSEAANHNDHITIGSGVSTAYTWAAGMYVNYATYTTIDGVEVSFTTLGGTGEAITFYESTYGTVKNSLVHDNTNEGITFVKSSDNSSVYLNSAYDNGAVGIYISGVEDTNVYRNLVWDNTSWGIAIADEGDAGLANVSVYYNISVSGNQDGIKLWDTGDVRGGSNILVYNNTIFSPDQYGINVDDDDGSMWTGVEIKNNIVYDDNGNDAHCALYIEKDDGVVSDYNLFYDETTAHHVVDVDGTGYTLATWATYLSNESQDANSIVPTDPLFVGGGGFRVNRNSPVIDAGTPVGLTMDYYGMQVPIGPVPDIGVMEYKRNQRRQYIKRTVHY